MMYHVLIPHIMGRINLSINTCTTVFGVKTLISQQRGWGVEQIRLLYSGQQLDNDKMLCDCQFEGTDITINIIILPLSEQVV